MKSPAIFVVLLFLLLVGCKSNNSSEFVPVNPQNPTRPLTFLALGDSYTIGESVPVEERWPVQLATQLNDDGTEIESPKIIATTGWTTAELQQAIAKEEQDSTVSPSYDLVSLLIGVNNQYRGYDFSIYEKEFEELLQKAIDFAGKDANKVFVVSIPDYGVTPFAASKDPEKIAREIDQYNAKAEEIANKYGVAYINITPISREAATDSSLIASDGLHPSGKMYTSWVSLIKPVVIGLLD